MSPIIFSFTLMTTSSHGGHLLRLKVDQYFTKAHVAHQTSALSPHDQSPLPSNSPETVNGDHEKVAGLHTYYQRYDDRFSGPEGPRQADTAEIRRIKGIIRRGEDGSRPLLVLDDDHIHFLDMPFMKQAA